MASGLITGWLGPGATLMNRHQVAVAAPPERAYRWALGVTLREIPIVRLLFTLRGIPYHKHMTIGGFFSTPPFLVLEEAPSREIVFGLAVQWTRQRRDAGGWASTPGEFRAFTQDGVMRAVANFRVDPRGSECTLSTETWVETFGARARRLFRAYWLVVGPFSGLIRRQFLRAARRRAEGSRTRAVS